MAVPDVIVRGDDPSLERRRVNDPGMSRHDDVAIEEDVE
jgi:hypothetical protein